jgi:surface polysaccharide O-acyltransferase-like enzyme
VDPKTGETALPVDLIRTVAVVLVILLHASIEPYPNVDFMSPQGVQIWWASNLYNSIAIVCIPLFVMLTGSLLLQPSKCEEPLRVFFKKRWRRIGIPIFFWGSVFFAWDFLVKGQSFTAISLLQGVIAGPYVHFWYLYALIGLYLITPVVRVVVAHANWEVIKYFLVLWLVGTGVVSLLTLIVSISPQTVWFRDNVFIFTGLIGYFILGAYVQRLRINRAILASGFILSTVCTFFGTYFLIGTIGEAYGRFFLDASSLSVIVASISLFLLLVTIPNSIGQNRLPYSNRALKVISENSLPIYLFQVIVLETLQNGYLGFKLSITTLNPIIEIPLLTGVTLVICLAIIVPLKKLPYVKRIIG